VLDAVDTTTTRSLWEAPMTSTPSVPVTPTRSSSALFDTGSAPDAAGSSMSSIVPTTWMPRYCGRLTYTSGSSVTVVPGAGITPLTTSRGRGG
jgi:hypothetical protein